MTKSKCQIVKNITIKIEVGLVEGLLTFLHVVLQEQGVSMFL
jgi:hypothetical protein